MQRAVSLTTQELRVVAALASIFSLRMLGLCMLLPVFAIEANNFPYASEQLIGLAIGVYGLAQALLQLPFGILSDKYGRKPVLLFGLALLLLGSLISARATTIYGLIFGRLLQGSGAIGSVIIATLLDHTREEARSLSMAILGISIGLAFVVAMVLGPWLTQVVGLAGIFWLTACLALGGIALLILAIPKTVAWQPSLNMASLRQSLGVLCKDSRLFSLNLGVFVLHASLAALFLVLPLLIRQTGFATDKLWRLYLVTLSIALLFSLKLITQAEYRKRSDFLQIMAIGGLLVAEIMLSVFNNMAGIGLSLIVFFTAFCVLEASLPSLVSKFAPANNRGVAMGMYSSLQFLGIFFGGSVGGWLHGQFGVAAVLGFCLMLATIWFSVSLMVRYRVNLNVAELGLK
jgi:predicted MFS family arabinose efflux permease